MTDELRISIIAGLVVAATGGIAHVFWQILGWPCVYPIVKRWALRQWRNQHESH